MSEPARQTAWLAADMDESSLLERARSGDREATELLVRHHLRDVYEMTARVLGDRDLAEDAAQDAFVNMLRALPRFRGESSFKTWLLRIALNSARTVGRRKTRRRETPLTLVDEMPDHEVDAATRLVRSDEARRIEERLARLPEKQRLAVSLRLQQGLSYAEIAAAMDGTEGAARVNYHLGIKRLRELMNE